MANVNVWYYDDGVTSTFANYQVNSNYKAWYSISIELPAANRNVAFIDSTFYLPNNSASIFSRCKSFPSNVTINCIECTDMTRLFDRASVTELDLNVFINTSNVASMQYMFNGCTSLTEVDMISFDTSSVTNMSNMFYNCSKLERIRVSNNFVVTNVSSSLNMFTNCTSLVGIAGTTYDSNKIDKTYAHIDGGTANPGYFSGPPQWFECTPYIKENGVWVQVEAYM